MTDDGHIGEDTLIDYADDPASVSDRAEVEKHLQSCPSCCTKVNEFRLIVASMHEEETWWAAGEIRNGVVPRDLRELAAKRAAEDAEAERLLRPLLESEYRFTYSNITRRRKFQTGGVARLLCSAAREELDRDPRFAQSLAETAAVIAESLPDDYYPASAVNELRGTAWKEYSTACCYLAQFESGLSALGRAERAFRRLSDSALHLAAVDLGRALIHWEQQRYSEALLFARTAADAFSQRRETVRYFEAKEVEALILHRQGNVAAACETYHLAFDLADTIGDSDMKARSARNLGIAYRDMGDLGSAGKFLLIALQLYEALGQYGGALHARWSIARLALSGGNAHEAARQLPPLVAELTRLGKASDAAHAQLDLAEALLLLGRFEDVQEVCTSLVSFFRSANMLTGALTAAAFLKEAASRRVLTREHLQSARTYLVELERAPDLPFVPPPSLT